MSAENEISVFWNSRVRNITPYIPGEQPKDKTFIKLNTNENPYPPSPAVFDALRGISADRLRLYPDPSCAALRNAVARVHGVTPDEVFAGNGSDEILAFAFAAFFESRDNALPILFPDITYSFYPVYAALWDIPFYEIALGEDWNIGKREYFKPSGGVVIANPNAPTGCLLPQNDILEIADFAAQHNAVTIVDEAYSAFAGESIVPLLSRAPNILSVHTYSKAYSLAGMRAGYAIGGAPLITALERIRDSFNSYTLDAAAQAAACAAINDRAYFNEIRAKIIATRERISAVLRARSYTVLPSAANFIFVRHPALSGVDFFRHLRKNNILARYFGKERIKDFLRITIGTDRDMDTLLDVCG